MPALRCGACKMPLLRVMRTQEEVLVAICDAKLLGKEFRQKELRLKIDEGFYRGEEASVESCLQALKEATIANLVGSIVEHAVKAGFVDRENVMMFKNVPHAQIVKM